MGLEYVRVMPQAQLQTVGSFFLLDHFFERELLPQPSVGKRGTGPHPHRGITTLTYILKGSNEHLDSQGNHAIVESGSVQWMKSGRGIVHDEGPPEDFHKQGGDFHMMQFWLLLGDDEREDEPHYMPLTRQAIPEKEIDSQGSKLRILLGEYCGSVSPLPYRKSAFLYHLVLQPGALFYYTIPSSVSVAILPAKGDLSINKELLKQSELIACEGEETTLELLNTNNEAIDVMIFGGEPFGERFYSSGPFVMSDYEGIVQAHQDYNAGKYGEIAQ